MVIVAAVFIGRCLLAACNSGMVSLWSLDSNALVKFKVRWSSGNDQVPISAELTKSESSLESVRNR